MMIRSGARTIGMAAMLLIVAAAFAPLCAALATCAMPCCHPMAGLTTPAGGENPCPVNECTIARAPEAAPAVAPQSAPSGVATPVVIVELTAAPAIAPHVLPDEGGGGAPHGGRALHLVHSVFLI